MYLLLNSMFFLAVVGMANKNLETVSKQLDKISESNTDIKTISITADSIATKTKEILKTIKKHKAK